MPRLLGKFRLTVRHLAAMLLAMTGIGFAKCSVAEQPATAAPEYGSAERNHWSFLPLAEVKPPQFDDAADRAWIRTPIDAFILKELQAHSLTPAPRADRRTLIRRVTFDLTGLPPTPEEIADFLSEPAFDRAWSRLVDRLLDSPHYGIQWGQYWLDVVRYAESEGFEYDRHLPGAWMFRDYVIHAFNADVPYDQFIREQLAGDELVGPIESIASHDRHLADDPRWLALVGAGFHRLGPVRRNAGNAAVAFSRHEVLTERTDIIGTAFLGLSVGCARCHDHMFDPIRQADYYRLQAFLASTYEHDVPLCDRATFQQWQQQTEALNAEIERVKEALAQADGEEEARLQQRLKELKQQLPEPLPTLFSVQNAPEKRTPIHVLERGDEGKPLAEVGMRGLGVLLAEGAPVLPPDYERPRSQLADWIASSDNPLTARVMVNRIWQQHFGTGLVSTANDFGLNGDSPSHPELLSWLAGEFLRSGWSIKEMHRLILNSSTYLQSGSSSESRRQHVDPRDRLLARFPRRRLSASELRDAMLHVAGRLNEKMGGPSVMVPVDPDLVGLLYDPEQWQVTPDTAEHDRRSIYLVAKRNLRLPFMEVFDQPDLQTSCARREQSTHAPQALELVNGQFANEMAIAFAQRLQRECGSDRMQWVQRAFELTCGRAPSHQERTVSMEFLSEQPLSEFALALFSLNAFLYVE